MTLDEYQKKALSTEIMDGTGSINANSPIMVAKILGLVGEAGEVAEKFKKIIRDKEGELSEEDKQEIAKELGDVMWYIATLSEYIGFSLSDVAKKNVKKLADRKNRGVQTGSGDNR